MSPRVPLLLVPVILGACGKGSANHTDTSGASRTPPPVPVAVGKAERADVPREIRAVGTVEPLASVTIKPQVEGRLVDIRFEEGAEVRAGDLLLQIDPRPYEAVVLGAEADLLRDRALADDARAAAEQIRGAHEKSAVSRRTADQAAAAAAAAEALVQKATAMLETAKLQLEYCSIRAPFDARTGKLAARRGTVVKANETELVELHQIVPIRVAFAVPEKHLTEIRRASAESPLVVRAEVAGSPPVEGTLTFLDNEVDRATGTIRLMATFSNEGRVLWPGQFVQVVLRIDVERGVLLVPTRAVQTGQEGDYVFVVAQDGTVAVRNVHVRRTNGDSTVLEDLPGGLEGSETVVTEGQLRLVPGTRVEAQVPAGPPAERSVDQTDR